MPLGVRTGDENSRSDRIDYSDAGSARLGTGGGLSSERSSNTQQGNRLQTSRASYYERVLVEHPQNGATSSFQTGGDCTIAEETRELLARMRKDPVGRLSLENRGGMAPVSRLA